MRKSASKSKHVRGLVECVCPDLLCVYISVGIRFQGNPMTDCVVARRYSRWEVEVPNQNYTNYGHGDHDGTKKHMLVSLLSLA